MSSITASQLDSAHASGELSVTGVPLGQFPEEIRGIPNLRKLTLTDCGIPAVPDWIEELQELEKLDLGHNHRLVATPAIGSLESLRTLGLSAISLAGFGDWLGSLTQLEALVLTSTNLRSLPPSIGGLQRLQFLDAGCNPLIDLPDELEQLEELVDIRLWAHEFDRFPPVLCRLPQLRVIDLSRGGSEDLDDNEAPDQNRHIGMARVIGQSYDRNGAISHLPEDLATSLPDLRELYLGGQSLQTLPDKLPPLMESVFVSRNLLHDIPKSVLDLTDIRRIDAHTNRIGTVPANIAQLTRLSYLNLADNPLPIPPEVLAEPNNPKVILDFVVSALQSTKRLNQAKLLVVGEGSVGKTSLIKRLVSDDFSIQESKTEGIDVTRWSIDVGNDPILLNVWDFGGQEIMHATHQFFLTKRSLYLLVVDARQGDDQNRIEYWLKLIHSFSDASPVIIVGNKTDQSKLDIDTRGLRAKYPNIVGIVSASCKTGAGIASIHEVLAETIDDMPHVRDQLPEAFFEVKRDLDNLDEDYLPYAGYQTLCEKYGVSTRSDQELLVGFLHDLGTVLCFREDPRLSDTNILNPEWVTGGVYKILNSHLAAQRKGLLSWEDVHSILDTDDYPPGRRTFIVDMMKRFELCFEADDVLLVPDLLTKEEPDTGSWDDALQFEIKYDVLPSSVISRLIVRVHTSLSHATVWRTGLVVAVDGNRGLVKGDREDGIVKISISGPVNGRRGLLTVIRDQLRAIGSTIPGLSSEERVPVPDRPGVWVPYKHLIDLEVAGHESVVPQGLTEEYPIRQLLAGVEAPNRRDDEVVITGSPSASEATSTEAPTSTPWTPMEALRLGGALVGVLAISVLLFLVAAVLTDSGTTAAITTGAIAVVVIVAAVMLRSSDRLSEDGFLGALGQVFRRE